MKKSEIRKQLLEEIRQLKDRKGFLKAGLPRFARLFGRDSLVSAWQLLNFKPGICKATLEILSKLQGKVINGEREEEPGKIIHEADFEKRRHPEGGMPFPYYGSVDSTPLYLILFSLYFKKTKDKKFLNNHWGNILMALNWMEERGDKDKDLFLEYQRENPEGLFHQGWKDGFRDHLGIKPPVAIIEVQGYQYLALKEISELAAMKHNRDLAKRLQDRAENLKKTFNNKFWMEDKKYFALGLDGKNKQRRAISSNPGQLLFTGIIDENKVDSVVSRLFKRDLWTPFGIRTYSDKESDFDPLSYHLGSVWPHDNWIISQGFKKLGYKKEYQKIKTAILAVYEELGFLPELYAVTSGKINLKTNPAPCSPQAWATCALFNFLSD